MSFCRFSEGEVYMIPTNKGIMCCACALSDESPTFTRIEDAITHLEEHRCAGHKAPYDEAIDMLQHTTIEIENGAAKYDTDILQNMNEDIKEMRKAQIQLIKDRDGLIGTDRSCTNHKLTELQDRIDLVKEMNRI